MMNIQQYFQSLQSAIPAELDLDSRLKKIDEIFDLQEELSVAFEDEEFMQSWALEHDVDLNAEWGKGITHLQQWFWSLDE